MNCSSGCPAPGTHQSWGECVRAKSVEVEGVEAHRHNQNIYATQNAYADARRAGLQPDGVWKKDVDRAWRITERTGTPYRADA